MKKVAIVSCDKWIGLLEEDKNLVKYLTNLGLDAKLISWQQELDDEYDLLLIKSVWGYHNYYDDFIKWLQFIDGKNIQVVNDSNIIINNINKDIQFSILQKNGIECIETSFLSKDKLDDITKFLNKPVVVKPSISGSGDNTFIIDNYSCGKNIIHGDDVKQVLEEIITKNNCKIMVQPYVSEINNGEYSCIYIDGVLTHTMLRFPAIFHEKERPYLVTDVPSCILELAKKVESISEYRNYLYMRVDMVIVDGVAKIMEVELADPDLLTKYINDSEIKHDVLNTYAKRIRKRVG